MFFQSKSNDFLELTGFFEEKGLIQNFQKSANLINILLHLSMSILAATSLKTKKIVRKVPHSSLRLKFKEISNKNQKLFQSSSLKCSSINESLPTIHRESSQTTVGSTVSLSLNYFQSFNPYTLGSINSFVFNNGRIYDMMYIKKGRSRRNKVIKCRCTKSKCSAKYCDCFSNGQSCGISCQCVSCTNQSNKKPSQKSYESKICRCSKSECQKNYCQCYQRGDACSSKCQCQNCRNTSGSITDDNL